MRKTAMVLAATLVLLAAAGSVARAATISCPNPSPQEPGYCYGTGEADTISGTAEGDNIDGRGGADVLHGRAGDDLLLGGFGRDTLRGGRGADELGGREGRDTEHGGPGSDTKVTPSSGDGNDRVFGGRGDDWLSVYSDRAEHDPAKDVDLLDCGPGHDVGIINRGVDTVRNCEELFFEED